MSSLKPGTITSKGSLTNKAPRDPIDRLIHEHGLRIKDVYINRSLDLMLVVLNNGTVIRSGVSEHVRLRNASQVKLKNWKLIAGGTGVTWPELDEDLSLRGFIHAHSLEHAIRSLTDTKAVVAQSAKPLSRRAR
jgi:hypothetical protein